MISEFIKAAFTISLVIFMIGSLSAMGLQLRFADAIVPLKNARFVLITLLSGFLIGPTLGYLVVLVVPMERHYAVGLLLLSMAPAAPFLPLVVKKANGNLAAAAGLMLLASVGTIVVMPFGVPLVAPGLSASAWSIAKPLIFLVLAPLALGIFIKSMWADCADHIYRFVNSITSIATVLFLAMVLILNFKSFLGSVGSHAFLAQLLYVPALAVAGYLSAVGMPETKRSVMSLGMCTRNIGVGAAIVGAQGDQRTMVMLVIATLVTVAFSFAAASWFARRAPSALAGQSQRTDEGRPKRIAESR
ncbi:MAG: bile acid:sodium symporter family protein [Acidobacteriota bacterium]